MNTIDPITLEVVRGSLVSTVHQMRATLMKTAYAPILYETLDFSCGIMTSGGELAAMSEDFSGHVFAMALGLNASREKFGEDIYPGDVLAVNDPYTGGTHMNDVAFYLPFFVDNEILLFIAVRAHYADVGGATPGSFSGQDTEIYQEGMRIVPVKLIDRGKLNQGLWDVLFANMRLTEERQGDALAMLDTARVAEMNVVELCSKYGPDTIQECIDVLLDSAEATMKKSVALLDDGEYYYEHYMDNMGLSPEPLPIKVKLVIQDESMTFDFTGTAAQVPGPMNCGIPVTQGGVFVVVKSWFDPKTPVNGGTFRPMRFIVPKGSCLAATLPAAVGGCWDLYRQIQSSIVGVFSQVMPDDQGGENLGAANHCYVAGGDPVRNKPYILYEYPEGGSPATSDTDGVLGSRFYDSGDMAGAYPAESTEQRQPLLIESLSAGIDAESAGFRRSGPGVVRRIKVLSDTSQLNVMTDRAIIPPWGSSGATPGSTNSFTVIRDGQELQPSPIPGKVKSFPLQSGDVVLMRATAGGGVGDPLTREPHLVLKDVMDGYVSAKRARDTYGVVIEGDSVDLKATNKLREEIRTHRLYFKVLATDTDEYDERGCRVSRLSPDIALALGVLEGDMIDHVAVAGAPLRAWVTISQDVPQGAVLLGPAGRGILGVKPDERIWVRPLLVATPIVQ